MDLPDPSLNRIVSAFRKNAKPHKPLRTLTAKLHRDETIVKGFDQKVKLNLLPNGAFDSLSEERQKEILEDIKGLKLSSFSANTETGHIEFDDRDVGEYVYLQVDDNDGWKYDGGEVSIVKSKYNRKLDEP